MLMGNQQGSDRRNRELNWFKRGHELSASLSLDAFTDDVRGAGILAVGRVSNQGVVPGWRRTPCSLVRCITFSSRCSPSQIAGIRKLMWPDTPQRSVSHETIYNCVYAMPRGELRKDRIACLRRAQSRRTPCIRGKDRFGHCPTCRVFMCDRQRPTVGHSPGIGKGISSKVLATALQWVCWWRVALASSGWPGWRTLRRLVRGLALGPNWAALPSCCARRSAMTKGKELARHAELRARTCRSTAKRNSRRLPDSSIAGRALSTSPTRRSTPAEPCWKRLFKPISQFNESGVALNSLHKANLKHE